MTPLQALVTLPVLLPMLGAATSVVVSRRASAQRVIGVVTLTLVCVVAAVLLVAADANGPVVAELGGWSAPMGIVLVADRMSALLLLISTVVTLAVLVYAIDQRISDYGRETASPPFHPIFLLLSTGVSLAYLTGERHDGSVILLHDRKWLTLHIVTEVLEAFSAGGWRFEAVAACRSDGQRRDRMATRGPGDVPVGLVERVWSSDGAVHLSGWAFDADLAVGGLEILVATAAGPTVLGATSGDHDFRVIVGDAGPGGPVCLWARNAGRERHDTSLGCHLPELVAVEQR